MCRPSGLFNWIQQCHVQPSAFLCPNQHSMHAHTPSLIWDKEEEKYDGGREERTKHTKNSFAWVRRRDNGPLGMELQSKKNATGDSRFVIWKGKKSMPTKQRRENIDVFSFYNKQQEETYEWRALHLLLGFLPVFLYHLFSNLGLDNKCSQLIHLILRI